MYKGKTRKRLSSYMIAQHKHIEDRKNARIEYEKEKQPITFRNKLALKYFRKILITDLPEYDFSEVFSSWEALGFLRNAAIAYTDIKRYCEEKAIAYPEEKMAVIRHKLSKFIEEH